MQSSIPTIFHIDCYSSIKLVLSSIAIFFMSYFQAAPDSLRTLWIWLIILFCVDTTLGFAYAAIEGRISSIGLKGGVIKLLSYLSLVLIGASLDCMVHIPYVIAGIITGYIILTESVSIVENIRKLGVPVPDFLEKLINRIMEKVDDSANLICPVEEDDTDCEPISR